MWKIFWSRAEYFLCLGKKLSIILMNILRLWWLMPQKLLLSVQKKQKKYYSGKKKRHTIKTQVVVDKKTRKVIAVDCSVGKTHDFNWFKKSKLLLRQFTKILTDSGYQGIQNLHDNTELPQKRRRAKNYPKKIRKKILLLLPKEQEMNMR